MTEIYIETDNGRGYEIHPEELSEDARIGIFSEVLAQELEDIEDEMGSKVDNEKEGRKGYESIFDYYQSRLDSITNNLEEPNNKIKARHLVDKKDEELGLDLTQEEKEILYEKFEKYF